MVTGRPNTGSGDLRALFQVGSLVGMSDTELLERYVTGCGGIAEVAFAALVERHGATVLRVCTDVLNDTHDAQDAAQVTFLVLAQRAGSIRRRHALPSWLFGVARRVAARARVEAARRRVHERRRAEMATREHERRSRAPVTGEPWAELFEEIDRLTERHRSAIVLCDLEGLTHEQAAQRLGCPVKTVQGRLYRARELLRHRLTRRGITATAGMLDVALAQRTASAAPSAAWVQETARAAAQLAAGQGVEQLLSAESAMLFRHVLRAMTMTNLKIAALGGLVLATTAVGMTMGWGRMDKPQVVDRPPPRDVPPVADAAAPDPAAVQRQIANNLKPADPPSRGKQAFRAVATETGQPIEGVSIEYRGRFDGMNQEGTVTTGKDGMATVEYPAGAHIAYFEITARKPHFVPVSLSVSDRFQPVDLAVISELRFEPGTTIGGIVKDAAGRPIEGAAINVHGRAKQEGDRGWISFQEIKTDAKGRWRVDVAPRDLAGVNVTVIHPRYASKGGLAARDLESTIVLSQGPSVIGRVVDSAGRPVKGAEVGFGHDRFDPNAPTATANERGEFTIENCARGPSIITVQADGFAPQIANVTVNEHTRPVEIQLAEPGSVLRVRVVDVAGKPVTGAFFGANTWRGQRSLRFYARTDKDGRIEWRNAPKDAVLYGTGNFGYMSSRDVQLIADGREHVITLSPELVISGRVTDAQTGKPLPIFRLIRTNWILGSQRGALNERWARNEAIEITGGRYTTRFSEPAESFYLRVEAAGYLPAESRAFQATEGNQTFDFALQRGQNQLSGTVVLPDGKPAAGAEILVNTEQMGWLMQAGHFDERLNVPRITAGSGGRFWFTPPSDPYYLIAISDAGYAHVWPEDFARTERVVLQPWGKIEGELRIGREPAAHQQVEFYPEMIQRAGKVYNLSYGYTTLTDKRGRFAFGRVAPVAGRVSRHIPSSNGGFPAWGWQEPVAVQPGQTARVQLGGKGRPVVGRIVLDGATETTVDWTNNQPVMIRVPLDVKDARAWRCFGSYIDKEGRFRVDDVPAGKYELEVIVNSDAYPKVRGAEAVIGSLRTTIIVPEAPDGRADEPIDLGPITVRLFETLKAGDIAPDFTVARIAGTGKGDQFKLSDYQGKLILLDFWATWCGPCLAEMPAIKDIQKTFGSDARFQMIGLSLDTTAEAAVRYIKENGLIWTHGFTGNLLVGASGGNVYRVQGIPATFLIGPNGRILAKNLRGGELKEAVRKALEDRKLFPAQDRMTPKP